MRLQGKVAVVTGGSAGMGRAIAELFAREGARVVVNYNESRQAAEQLASDIRAQGGEAVSTRANVANDDEVREMMGQTAERWGRLDILVNNAGWTRRTPHHLLDDLSDEIWDRTLNVNLRGTFYCIRAAAPLLLKQPGACVINIASVAPYTGDGSSIVYAASKAGVISITSQRHRSGPGAHSLCRVAARDIRAWRRPVTPKTHRDRGGRCRGGEVPGRRRYRHDGRDHKGGLRRNLATPWQAVARDPTPQAGGTRLRPTQRPFPGEARNPQSPGPFATPSGSGPGISAPACGLRI
jgi:NADP-dependent 3-hydroxy acid dehydrogenase YdfG